MKINGAMLFHEMQKYFQVDYQHITQNNHVKTPVFYNTFFEMDEHIVLVDGKYLEDCLKRVNSAIIICLNKPSYEFFDHIGDNDLIILNDPMSEKLAFNIINYILDRYLEWDYRMSEVVFNREGFADLIERITDMLGLPIALTDADFRYIAFSSSSGEYVDRFVTSSNQLDPETVNWMQQQTDFKELENNTNAFDYFGKEHVVCKNIYHDNVYVGRLAVIIRNNVDEIEYCKAIFDYAAPYVERLYNQYESFNNTMTEHHKVHECLQGIFERKEIDRQAFVRLMNQIGIFEGQTFYVVSIIPRILNVTTFSSIYICDQLESIFPGSFCVTRQDSVTMLFCLTYYREYRTQDFFARIRSFLEELHLIAGISRKFHSFTEIEYITNAQEQALYALEFQREEQNLYPFDEVALSFLLQNGSRRTNFYQYSHPALIFLKEHDQQKGTSFLHTLHTYLECNMNAVEASRKLFIHRSSFINRMERIRELVDINLDNPMERLYLNISFAIYL